MSQSQGEFFQPSNGSVNVKKSYEGSFGNLPSDTVYQDLLGVTGRRGYDLRPEIAKSYEPEYQAVDEIMADGGTFREAMEYVAKTLTTGDYSLPVYPQEDLVDTTVRQTPLYEMIPKVAAETDTVTADAVTALGQPQIGGETDVPSAAADDTFTAQTLTMSYWRIRGAVSGPMQLASRTLRNAMGGEQQRKARSMRQFAENLVLNADPTAGTTDGSLNDERAFQGLIPALRAAGVNRDPAGGAGATITTEDVRESIRLATDDGGDPDYLLHITDSKTLMDLKNSMDDASQLTIDTQGGDRTLNFGARSVVIDGTPVVVSDFMPNQAYDGTNNPEGRAFLTVDMRFLQMHNLSDLVMEALAKTRDADEFFMKHYGVLSVAPGTTGYAGLIEGLE